MSAPMSVVMSVRQISFRFIISTAFAAARAVNAIYVIDGF